MKESTDYGMYVLRKVCKLLCNTVCFWGVHILCGVSVYCGMYAVGEAVHFGTSVCFCAIWGAVRWTL